MRRYTGGGLGFENRTDRHISIWKLSDSPRILQGTCRSAGFCPHGNLQWAWHKIRKVPAIAASFSDLTLQLRCEYLLARCHAVVLRLLRSFTPQLAPVEACWGRTKAKPQSHASNWPIRCHWVLRQRCWRPASKNSLRKMKPRKSAFHLQSLDWEPIHLWHCLASRETTFCGYGQCLKQPESKQRHVKSWKIIWITKSTHVNTLHQRVEPPWVLPQGQTSADSNPWWSLIPSWRRAWWTPWFWPR